MNIYLISEYINKLKKSDITYYAEKQGIILDDDECSIIYNYIKNNYKNIIYNNSSEVLEEIKLKLKPITYNKIESLYYKSKDKIELFKNNIKK